MHCNVAADRSQLTVWMRGAQADPHLRYLLRSIVAEVEEVAGALDPSPALTWNADSEHARSMKTQAKNSNSNRFFEQ